MYKVNISDTLATVSKESDCELIMENLMCMMNKTPCKVPESELDESKKDVVNEVSCYFKFLSFSNIF